MVEKLGVSPDFKVQQECTISENEKEKKKKKLQ